ncbi:RraA family protein [Streptomyces viridochromogenes]|uniref:RraA family protein n=1 Tax=Streptomyces viridochromogenes TaxID=1938 RepID=UPI00069F4D3F|nr:aldolase [Streptomyces viridochromogenes]KOG24353.1 aldolase [Streptomyces viridochromogenes]KOG25458.1 aldolase [Streptomyces viridochromogenes]
MTYSPTSAGSPNIEVGPAWQRPDSELLAEFRRHSVANIGDALGRLGMPDGGITPIWDGCRAVGSALTVLTVAGDDLAVIDAVAHIEPGDFLVINGFGYPGRAVMGDILAQYFSSRGAVGAIVDGAVRDRDEIRQQGFPVWSRTVTPAGPWKNGPGALGTPVAIGGVVITPGDIIAADSDGIVAVPLGKARDIAADLARIAESEQAMRSQAKQAPTK